MARATKKTTSRKSGGSRLVEVRRGDRVIAIAPAVLKFYLEQGWERVLRDSK